MSYEAWIIATGILVGVSRALIGTFLVLRNMAMLADAISHTVFARNCRRFPCDGSP